MTQQMIWIPLVHPKYENLSWELKSQKEVIYSGPTPMERKLHTSLATLKALMLKIPIVIVKN